MPVVVVRAPDGEPVTLDEAIAHIVDPPSVDYDDIRALIAAATRTFERETNRSLMPRQLRLELDAFPRGREHIRLPFGPVSAVTAFGYIDNGAAASLVEDTDFLVDLAGDVPRLAPVVGDCWTWVDRRFRAVAISYTAGYGELAEDPEDEAGLAEALAAARALIPADIKRAILVMVADQYRDRESTAVGTIVATFNIPTAAARVIEREHIPYLA